MNGIRLLRKDTTIICAFESCENGTAGTPVIIDNNKLEELWSIFSPSDDRARCTQGNTIKH